MSAKAKPVQFNASAMKQEGNKQELGHFALSLRHSLKDIHSEDDQP